MSTLDSGLVDLGAECQEDARVSQEALERRASQLAARIGGLDPQQGDERARLLAELARVEVELSRGPAAWNHAREAFDHHVARQDWEAAVMACDILFASGEPDALVALGHGLWLAITYPVDPEVTLRQLTHVIEDTPEDSDGAAVAAAVAAYVVELRAGEAVGGELTLAVGRMLGDVARRHGGTRTPGEYDAWFRRLELDRPEKFLVRMRNVIDVLVQDQWWIDRAALQAALPMER